MTANKNSMDGWLGKIAIMIAVFVAIKFGGPVITEMFGPKLPSASAGASDPVEQIDPVKQIERKHIEQLFQSPAKQAAPALEGAWKEAAEKYQAENSSVATP